MDRYKALPPLPLIMTRLRHHQMVMAVPVVYHPRRRHQPKHGHHRQVTPRWLLVVAQSLRLVPIPPISIIHFWRIWCHVTTTMIEWTRIGRSTKRCRTGCIILSSIMVLYKDGIQTSMQSHVITRVYIINRCSDNLNVINIVNYTTIGVIYGSIGTAWYTMVILIVDSDCCYIRRLIIRRMSSITIHPSHELDMKWFDYDTIWYDMINR